MASEATNSYIPQALDNEKKVSCSLIDRALNAKLTLAQGCSVTKEHLVDVEARFKNIMPEDIHKRFASPSFPVELRLQVMKAAVLRYTSHWHVRLGDTVGDMRDVACSSVLPFELWDARTLRFNTSWRDGATRDILVDTAKEAFIETAIFKIDAAFTNPDWTDGVVILQLPRLLLEVGARINYLEVAFRVKVINFAQGGIEYHSRNAWSR